MRTALSLLLAAGGWLASTAALAQSPSTTRVETRPFYGATVTLEEGVRVFRPLPPHQRIIINPGGITPLNLAFEENRTVSLNGGREEAGEAGDREANVGLGDLGSGTKPRRVPKDGTFAARKVNGTAAPAPGAARGGVAPRN